MDFKKFSKKELMQILDIIQYTLACKDEFDLKLILELTKTLVCADLSISAIAKGGKEGVSSSCAPKILNGNYPDEWLKIYGNEKLYFVDPTIWHNFQHPGAQLWDETYGLYGGKVPQRFISLSSDFGLCHGVSGGYYNSKSGTGTIFGFGAKRKWCDQYHKDIMSILAPHLHQALARISSLVESPLSKSISKREKEVLYWIREGKTNWEISQILKISECTVKFHVQNIENKLNAVNKHHAVAIALENELIN